MFSFLKRWYQGEGRVHVFDNDPDSSVFILPLPYTHYHWTAKAVRAIVAFCCLHWKFLIMFVVSIIGLYLNSLSK